MRSKADLAKFFATFTEALGYWGKLAPEFADISPANVDKPLDELVKLSKLIKAHTTKVGIVYNPDNLKSDDFNAQYTTSEQLMQTASMLVTVLAQLALSNTVLKFFANDTIYLASQLFLALQILINECRSIVDDRTSGEVQLRLVSVGKVWKICDELVTLVLGGELVLLSTKISQSLLMIDDGFEDFKEWAEDPQSVEFDDMFDDFGSDESDEEEAAPVPIMDAAKQDEMRVYAKRWAKKLELVRLLISSFKKLVPKATKAITINEIYQIQHHLVGAIDKFISDLMLEGLIDDELTKYTDSVSEDCHQLVKIAISIHNEKKAKWYTTWKVKYDDI